MNAYGKLPALLRRIEALESGAQLCRRRDCYSRLGLFAAGAVCGFCTARFAFDLRLSLYVAARPSSLSPFVHISAC